MNNDGTCVNDFSANINVTWSLPDSRCGDEVGNPCHPLSGYKSWSENDFAAGDLEFSRYYFTAFYRADDTGLGEGWSHNYARRLETTHRASIMYLLNERGHVELYSCVDGESPCNLYRRQYGPPHLLRPNTDGGWTLTLDNGRRERYNEDGQLVRIEWFDQDLRAVDLAYDDLGRLVIVADRTGRTMTFNYDDDGRLVRIDLPDGEQLQYRYHEVSLVDDGVSQATAYNLEAVTRQDTTVRQYLYEETGAGRRHLLTGIIDASGRRYSTYTYDEAGRVLSSQRAGGTERVSLEYVDDPAVPGEWNFTRVTTPQGAQLEYQVHNGAFRRPAVITDEFGGTQDTDYDAMGRVTRTVDLDGNINRIEYDGIHVDRVVRGLGSPVEQTVEHDWDLEANRPSEIRREGQTESFTYTDAGQLETHTVTDTATGESSTWTYTYYGDAAPEAYRDRLETIDGPRPVNDVTTFYYRDRDAFDGSYRAGDLHRIVDAAGNSVEYRAYDGAGRPVRIADSNGVVEIIEYDARGRTVRLDRAGEVTVYAWEDFGPMRRVTYPDGGYLRFEHDAAHRLTDIYDALGNRRHYQLDALGSRDVTQFMDALGNIVYEARTDRDLLGRLDKIYDAYGAMTDFDYYADNDVRSITDPHNRPAPQSIYDGLDRLEKTIDPDGNEIVYGYDGRNNITSILDPLDNVTNYLRDGFDRVREISSPDSGTTTIEYDEAGNARFLTDARSETQERRYDELGRLTDVLYTSDRSLNVTFGYDSTADGNHGRGRRTSMQDGSGSTDWRYDDQGRVVRTQSNILSQTYTTEYVYDETGRMDSVVLPDGTRIEYENDAMGRPSSIAIARSGQSKANSFINSIEYLPFGPIGRIDYSRHADQVREYDRNYNPEGFVGVDGLDVDVDAVGNVSRINLNGSVYRYDYDNLDRLTKVRDTSGNVIESFDYDANGNRKQHDGVSYFHDPGSNRLNATDELTYESDAAGNVTRELSVFTQRVFEYGAHGRLVTSDRDEWNGQYRYNGLGQRVWKQWSQGRAPAEIRHFVYYKNGRLLGEYDQYGEPVMQYIRVGTRLVGVIRNGEFYAVHTDHRGAPLTVVDADGNAVWRWNTARHVFGDVSPDEDPDGDGTNFVFNLRFPGQYYDEETRRHYNYFRHYEPQSGRYLQPDPLGMNAGPNSYEYVSGNPVGATDPSGLLKKECDPIEQIHTSTDYQFDTQMIETSRPVERTNPNCRVVPEPEPAPRQCFNGDCSKPCEVTCGISRSGPLLVAGGYLLYGDDVKQVLQVGRAAGSYAAARAGAGRLAANFATSSATRGTANCYAAAAAAAAGYAVGSAAYCAYTCAKYYQGGWFDWSRTFDHF